MNQKLPGDVVAERLGYIVSNSAVSIRYHRRTIIASMKGILKPRFSYAAFIILCWSFPPLNSFFDVNDGKVQHVIIMYFLLYLLVLFNINPVKHS